jgi:hypothetical protein
VIADRYSLQDVDFYQDRLDSCRVQPLASKTLAIGALYAGQHGRHASFPSSELLVGHKVELDRRQVLISEAIAQASCTFVNETQALQAEPPRVETPRAFLRGTR